MTDLAVGEPAPEFTLQSSGGGTISLRDFRGSDVVLYFYPKDDTSGCTAEACNFRDRHEELTGAGVTVLGVSPDGVDSHDRFADKYTLPFPLLADTDHAVAEAYGVWKERSMYGKTFMGIERSTFLIGPDGRIKQIWRKVKPENHAAEVLEAASA
jgi:peroxiredoxin Q/BCP